MKLFKNNKLRGDTNIISIIVLVVIILAVAVIFRDNLIKAVTDIFDKLNNFIQGS